MSVAIAILLVLWVSTAFFFIIRDEKAKENRESHEWWLSDLREVLHSIENDFSRNCLKITDKAFSQNNFPYSLYLTSITELKDEYINEVYNKVIATKRIRVKTIPEHLLNEYKRNISEIADIYRNIAFINYK